MLEVDIHTRLPDIALSVDVEIDAEILVLFGPSGAGKSLTLKMIAGVRTPDAGLIRSGPAILFDSERGIDLPPQRRRVGYVPQQYSLFPHFSAQENVAFPLRRGQRWSANRARERASELLAMVGLAERGSAMPRELSGGQQQRVALARALAVEPQILLLDEPFAALDAPIREELRQEFRSIQQRLRVPTIFVTHDLEEAATLAGRLAVMIDGRLRQVDRTRVVLDRPADRDVALLVQSRNVLRGTVVGTPDGRVLESPLGILPLAPPALAPGAPVDIVIRPEVIRVVERDRPMTRLLGDILLNGTVSDVVDHGTRAAVFVRIAATPLEVSLSPTAAARRNLQAGMAVTLAIPRGDVHVIAAS